MLPMLTGVVIMLAIGLFAQRSETIMSWLGEGETRSDAPQIVMTTDSVVVSRGGFTRLDVLANDANLAPGDAQDLLIVRAPECGDAFVQDGAVQYRPASTCRTFDTFTYRVAGAPEDQIGSVHVNIVSPEDIMAAKMRADEDRGQTEDTRTTGTGADPAAGGIAEAETAEPATPAQPPAQPLAEQAALADQTALADRGSLPDDAMAPMVEEADGPIGAGKPLSSTLASGETTPQDAPSGGVTSGELTSGELTVAIAVPDVAVPESAVIDDSPAPAIRSEAPIVHVSRAPGALQTAMADPAPAPELFTVPEAVAEIDLGLPELTEFNPEATLPRAELLQEPVVTLAAITADPSLQRDHLAALGRGRSAFGAVPSGPVNRLIAPNRATELAALADPAVEAATPPANPQNLTTLPALDVPTSGLAPLARPDKPVISLPVIAALPDPVAACTTPPSVSFDTRPAAQTGIALRAPCHPGGVAELSYNNLRFAIPLDGEGRGTFTALGFEPSTPATIRLDDGAEMSFDLAFKGVDQVMRVALAWDLPVQISLHALEFGADWGSEGDIWNANPKSYGEIRPTGGGYLTTYLPEQGAGQPVEIYTHLMRRNGRKGVVELKVEYTSRERERLAGTCGPGDMARPSIRILRSEGGMLGRPFAGRLPSVACDESGAGGNTLAANSVGTLVVTP
ncbi:MAG: hypothetical protein AAF503_10475 [Pseudomonadota bacterium]